ncbi:hypothetical protein HRR83_004864 [Exophiala dermatitidis]|uniref:Lipase/esterase n=2 Tax=Exophiala dermatitidis TaxID=5970 RepID=H6C3R2_EXODN|nr:lipase/esterase [Exophiala dermatitidis NIH/UT8656]KAJ4513970.1 hypothetical protein HRR75_004551 [Exophiala dermatitidis]EHY58277.1 lipase/esterase [Exophiala dermatitidis NIH/UT8656]KAJ4517221.1 hypothetical protein HRR74_004971 [Exophiala dermatitidis]KAJ4519602.1 hypothetical protein HRR73_003662 [Exophiala dermatitidis]KAJ4534601.1 hypothetical protein HRR76_006521 [Exophiala dermatitidis]
MEAGEIHDIRYVSNGHIRQKLDLYLPAGRSEPCPLLIYIHGGAFMFGTKETDLLPKHLTDKGYAVASLDYRLSGDAIFPAALEDCKAAVRWLRAHAHVYRIDPDRFVAWGESAGGHQAAMLGATGGQTNEFDVGDYLHIPSTVQGVVSYSAPTDFLKMDANAPPNSQKHEAANSPESRYLGGPITEQPEKVKKANPITYISPLTPPFFIAHGTDDHTVPFNQSELLVSALKEAGVPVGFHPVDGAEHVFRGATDEQIQALNLATESFLQDLFEGLLVKQVHESQAAKQD